MRPLQALFQDFIVKLKNHRDLAPVENRQHESRLSGTYDLLSSPYNPGPGFNVLERSKW